MGGQPGNASWHLDLGSSLEWQHGHWIVKKTESKRRDVTEGSARHQEACAVESREKLGTDVSVSTQLIMTIPGGQMSYECGKRDIYLSRMVDFHDIRDVTLV